jgi:tripartite-type tricarboxylate transporter receptor subunit TctC
VSKAPPDGYTLLIDAASFWIGPLLQETPYDPVKDFAPVTLTDSAPNVLVVNPSLPVKSVKELIALAKARPGELNYGSSSTGSTPHLAAELFNMMAGVKIVRVPFKGSGPAVISLLGGQVQLMFATAGSVAPHVKSGRLRALAVASLQPSALAPGLPTIAASGVPGYEAVAFEGMFAPAKTPVAIIDRLNQEIVRVLNRAEVKERFFNAGVETVGSTPEEFAAAIKSNVAKWGKLIKDAGIRDE